jgi:cytochrome c oxidase cbb3-type subunit I
LPGLSAATWLRTHFVTIGILTELAFAVITLVIARHRGPRAAQRWEIWLAFHAGLLLLLIGLPLINATLLISGGTLIFIAVTLLFLQLAAARPALSFTIRDGRPFYALSLLYLLLGIFLGTGLWLGWGKYIGLAGPKEVHVHTNLWGFTSLFFAGLFVDLYPGFARRALAWPRSISAIFWLMTLGALGMVVGPWLQLNLLTSLGLVLHTIATVWLLANLLKPLRHSGNGRLPGYWHLFSAYLWFFIPVVVAPLIVSNAESLAVGRIEQQGGAILIYGWILPICYALLPYLAARVFRSEAMPADEIPLGGSWLSLAAVQIGAALYWLGLLLPDAQAGLHAGAFLLWALSALPILLPLVRLLRHGLRAIAGNGEPLLATTSES